MEVLEHRSSSHGANDPPLPHTAPGLTTVEVGGSPQDLTGPPSSDQKTPECQGVREETTGGGEEEAGGALDVFHPGEAEEQLEWRPPSLVRADSLRCQVKITTRRNLHLRISNHTSRDVYVRLVGRQGRVSGSGTGRCLCSPVETLLGAEGARNSRWDLAQLISYGFF